MAQKKSTIDPATTVASQAVSTEIVQPADNVNDLTVG